MIILSNPHLQNHQHREEGQIRENPQNKKEYKEDEVTQLPVLSVD